MTHTFRPRFNKVDRRRIHLVVNGFFKLNRNTLKQITRVPGMARFLHKLLRSPGNSKGSFFTRHLN